MKTIKEFNLSERALTSEYDIRHLTYKDEEGIFRIKDIKEFIKRLKKGTAKVWWRRILHPLIDKLAGDKLI